MAHDKENQPETALSPHATETGDMTDYYMQPVGSDSGLARSLESRHLLMFSVGASIGMGLWLGSGSSLIDGGPAAIFLGYCIAGSIAWALNQAIGELAVLYPLASAFPQWTRKFIDAAPAFTVGWAYWFSASITLANELQGVVTVLSFWTDKVPKAAWLSIFLVVILLINVCAVRVFGEVEAAMSTIKLFWIIIVIITCIVISAGGAPNHHKTGFEYWNSMPFTHGFKGFLSVMSTCIFAMGGSEMGGIVAAEARNPKRSVPRAVNTIWLRLSAFYIIGSLVVTITVSPKDKDLFGGQGINASPFVIAFRNAGVPGLAHAMNAVIFISVLSSGNAQAYIATRTLVGLANINMAPQIFGKCDRVGRPWAAIVLTFLIGGGLSYLNVSESGATIFGWFSSLTALCILYLWGTIFLCHIRFRLAWKEQKRSINDLPWRTWTWPWGSIYGLTWCLLLVIVEFYLAVWPLGESSSAKNFFANYISVVAIVILFIASKIYYRGSFWIKAADIDLDTGRRYYVDDTVDATEPRSRFRFNILKVLAGDSKF
ncbi:histidine permease [Talaromyces proteolyticus]|uniref:Histidine permease n=1 Tax=Talaromyces proteolyticus TaxID=1131652 RepID=A0AAD4PTR2_9EURO|nr:histidine permease [Talaromyces proteolyticus]KAH8689119.1 histidine permease [Talaromyces proteolyticus]